MAFSKKTKELVLDRASGLCERILPNGWRCMAPGAEFHHIILKKMGGRHGEMKKTIDSPDNCMLVCLSCHRLRHEGKGWEEEKGVGYGIKKKNL